MAEDDERLFSDEAIDALRAHPQFRAACEYVARTSIAQFQALPEGYQWVTKDLGRLSICLSALVLHSVKQLTAQALVAACVADDTSSPGRVLQIVRRLEAMGQITVEDGPGLWTRRPMHVGDGLIDRIRARAVIEVEGIAKIDASAGEVLAEIDDRRVFLRYATTAALFVAQHRDLFRFQSTPATRFFMEREAGMLVLYDLMVSQSADRGRLMEAAPISRNALSKRYGISRAHINKLFDQAARDGWLGLPAPDRVHFSQAMSDTMERQFALIFQVARLAGRRLPARERIAGAA